MHQFVELIIFKSYSELKAESARYYFSFLWWIIEPVIYMGAFYIVFGLVFQRGDRDFVPFLLCGLVVWKWFTGTVNQGANSILANIGLIQQIYVHKVIFPSIAIITNTIRFLFVFFMLLIFLIIYGIPVKSAWLCLPLVMIAQFLFNSACSIFASVIVPFIPDTRMFLEKILMLGFFMSGIFFDIARVPGKLQTYFKLNPMAIIIEKYREILLHGKWPGWELLLLISVFSIIGIILSGLMMNRYNNQYPKVLLQ